MKKLLSVLLIIITLAGLSAFTVSAEENSLYDLSGIYDSLSDDVKRHMESIGADSADAQILSDISFDSIINEIQNIAAENSSSALKGLITITALLILCSILSAYKDTLSSDVSTALNAASALCISCAVAMPAIAVIQSAASVISVASNLMLAYIPVMVVLMASSGQMISSGSYYATMVAAGEGVSQLSSQVIVPFLNMFLGLSITSSVSPNINLGGFTSLISKTVKWILGFAMAIFTTLLSFKQIITNSLDTVSSRAVKFAISSFVPIVGSALSDAYKTVQGSVSILKSGIGIFVIIAIVISFLPIIIECLLWVLTLWIGKSTAEVLSLGQSAKLLENITSVFSTLIAILLCIMSIYVISTAIVFMAGGGGS